MERQIIEIETRQWDGEPAHSTWIKELEAGKVLYLPQLNFVSTETEKRFLTPAVLHPNSRNVSLDASGQLHGAAGPVQDQAALAGMIGRFREQAQQLVYSLFPAYVHSDLRLAPTSYRPMQVETRAQSWRADDRRLHVDAFPSRPNDGERILRVFANLNPYGVARVWRIGEPFEVVAKRFLPKVKAYSLWQARLLNALHITKSLRGEYDHIMLQLHDLMKSDMSYQKNCSQISQAFAAGSVWICFSDQTSHAVMSGQYMMEQTLHLPVAKQFNPHASPLAILQRLTKRSLTR